MAPRSATPAVEAANVKESVAATKPGKKDKNWVPPAEVQDEQPPYTGMHYDGSFLGKGFPERPLLQRLDWIHVPLLTITPALAIYGLLTVPIRWQTAVWSVLYYFMTGLGITAGV